MCGRFSQAYTWGEIYAFSQPLTEPASPARNLQARYNIAATTTIDILDTNSLFKRAYVKNRCIIPASGFYEWTGEEKNKTPHFISAKDGAILAFAGIWERWRDENGEEIISASIITRDANDWMSKIHTRMPAMLHPDDFEAWLDGSAGKEVLMRPPPELQEWVVDRRINKSGAGDDDPATAAPIGSEAAAPSASMPVQGTLF